MRSLTLRSASNARLSCKEAELSGKAPSGDAAFADTDQAALWPRYAVFLLLAIAGSLLDLWTKHAVFAWRGFGHHERTIYWLVEGYVGIETTLNQGALFGMGQGQVALFAALSFAAAIGILVWVFYGRAVRDWALAISLGCVMAGIIGNLYDRLGLWGGTTADGQTIYAVRDWILFCYKSYTWPNFNIADAFLVCGAGILVLHAWRQKENDGQSDGPIDKTGKTAKN